MKALSILQPWAWLIVNGHKDVENRTWPAYHRGPLLIHAGKKWGREQREDLAIVREMFPDIVIPDTFDLGGIVGWARLLGSVDRSPSPWFNGPIAFVLRDAKPLPFRPYRGQLGFFEVPDEFANDGAP